MEDRRRKTIARYSRPFSLRMLSALSRRTCIFPFYHMVSCRPPSHVRHLYPVKSEKEFAADMEYLLRYYQPISIGDYLAGKNAGKRQMVLSFDDGLVECHQFVAPYLKEKGIPAIFLLNNDFIDNRGLFYRFKASMLIDHLDSDKCHVTRASEFLDIPVQQVREAILMINHQQRPLLDSLALKLEFDEAAKLREQPVYMSTEQVKDLISWGFQVGAHGMDHAEFFRMETKRVAGCISKSMTDIRARFKVKPACFAFPFTSNGIPAHVIDQVLNDGLADVVFGTAGLKHTGRKAFIQRIPMETLNMGAERTLKAEYLYYLLKAPLGRNKYFRREDHA